MKTLLAALLGFALLLSMATAHSATYYFHNDHLGTPQVVTDSTQAVVWQGDYDPFGKATETVAKVEQNLRFPGQYLDRESGLHYNYFRTYDPSIGRYTQSDPIGLGGGVSTYGYAYQNSLRYTDPTGEFVPLAVWWALSAIKFASTAFDAHNTAATFADECSSLSDKVVAGGELIAGVFFPFSRVGKTLGAAKGVPSKFVKSGGGSDTSDFITAHSQKHMFDASRASTKGRSQFGQNINVKTLIDDTMENPTSAYSDVQSRITKYSKTYDFNISTTDTPTGEMRVFINNSKPSRSTQFPYVPRN